MPPKNSFSNKPKPILMTCKTPDAKLQTDKSSIKWKPSSSSEAANSSVNPSNSPSKKRPDTTKKTKCCTKCQAKKRHRGYKSKKIVTAVGSIKLKRKYTECLPCPLQGCDADQRTGESSYTKGARRLAVLAGTSWSFDKAAEYLHEFCGIKLSDNTIRDLCNKETENREQGTGSIQREMPPKNLLPAPCSLFPRNQTGILLIFIKKFLTCNNSFDLKTGASVGRPCKFFT